MKSRYTYHMSKETCVFILGVLVLSTPFMGFPHEYKDWFLIVIGILLMITGYRLRRLAFLHSLEDEKGERKADVFTESSVSSSDHVIPPV